MSYYSRLNLQLGRMPVLPDEYDDLYPLFQELHNAIHMLNANVDATVGVISPPKPEAPPSQGFTFQMRSFFAAVEETVTEAGSIVHLPKEASQYKLGATGYVTASTGGHRVTGPWCLTLGDRNDAGEMLLGVPPAVLALDGATPVGALVTTAHTGGFYIGQEGSKYWAVGQVIKEGFILLQPGLYI